MKRFGSILLVFVFCLLIFTSALASQGDATLSLPSDTGAAYAQAVMGDTLYLLTPGGLYSWREGDVNPVLLGKLSDDMTSMGNSNRVVYSAGGNMVMRGGYLIDSLLVEEGKLYGLDSEESDVYLLEIKDGQVTPTLYRELEWDRMASGQGSFMQQIHHPVLIDGRLYLLKSAPDFFTYELCRFNMEDGRRLDYDASLIADFTPYKDGKALILQYASQQDAMAKTGRLWLNILDLESGAVAKGVELPVASASGLAYDEGEDIASFFASGEIYAVDHMAEVRLAAFAPAALRGLAGTEQAVMLPGCLYSLIGEQTYLRSLKKGANLNRALRISGIQEDTYHAFTDKYPEIPVVLNDTSFQSAEMLMQDMAGGGSDLYCLTVNLLDFQSLIHKGYTASISQSETLMSLVEEMYPFIRDELYANSKLAAFPVNLSGSMMGYSKRALDELGLTEDDLPKTIPQMLEFITDWEDRFGEDHPSMALFEGAMYGDPTDIFFGWLLEAYQSYYQMQKENLTFDTPLFEKLMAAMDSADFSAAQAKDVQQAMASGSQAVTVVTYSGPSDRSATALFTMHYQAVMQEYGFSFGQFEPLPLSLDDGLEPVIPAALNVYVVNPYSKNQDLAITYLEHFAGQRSKVNRMALSPVVSEPVINAMYEKRKADLDEQIASLTSQQKNASEEEKKEISQSLDALNHSLSVLNSIKWLVSEEDLAAYQSRVRQMVVSHINPLALMMNDQGMVSLLNRYMERQIDRTELMKALEEKLQMRYREGK